MTIIKYLIKKSFINTFILFKKFFCLLFNNEKYNEKYIILTLISLSFIILNLNNSINFFTIFSHSINAIFIIYTFVNIIKKYSTRKKYENFKLLASVFAAIMFFFATNILFINELQIQLIYYLSYILFSLSLLFTLIFIYFYIVLRYCKKWGKLALNIFFTPAIAYLLFGLIEIACVDTIGRVLIINPSIRSIVLVILSSILINISVWIIPFNRIKQLKISLQLLVAIFSIISYSTIFSYDIALFIANSINKINEETIVFLTSYIDFLVKKFTLPYLVGIVISWFFISLRELKESQ